MLYIRPRPLSVPVRRTQECCRDENTATGLIPTALLCPPMPGADSPLHQISQQWQYALICGVLALPFTALSYWQTGSELSLSPVFVGGILAGYLTTRRTGTGRGVGARAGLVGGLPVLWLLFDFLNAASALAGPAWFVASATILTTVGTVVFGFGIAAFIGEVGGKFGSWVASRRSGHSTPTVDL